MSDERGRPRLIGGPRWRWDGVGIFAGALLLQLASRTSSAYFLHFDTLAQNVAALEWVHGCREYSTSKILPVMLLSPVYHLFGPSENWETVLLMVGAAVSVALVYELARLLSRGRAAGVLAALIVAALPAFQYFSRTHLGYPMPWLLLGWLAACHKRWNWVGLCFGLSITAHYNSSVPVGLSLIGLALLHLRPGTWKRWVGLVLWFALPLVAAETWFLFYTRPRVLLQWSRTVFHEVLRLSTLNAVNPQPDWLWVWHMAVASNGPLLTAVLGLGLPAFLLLRRIDRTGAVLLGTFVGLAAVYTLQGGLGRALLVSRVLATSYPFWAISAGLVIAFLIERLRAVRWQRVTLAAVSVALVSVVIETGMFCLAFTQTPYPFIAHWMAEAARANRPVRYAGNFWVGSYFAQLNGLEMLVDDDRWIHANAPGQAVLVFEGTGPASLTRTDYDITSFARSGTPDKVHPELTKEAGLPRRAEVWWPRQPSHPIGRPVNPPQYSVYFGGSGCVSPPAPGDELPLHQWVWQKVRQRLELK